MKQQPKKIIFANPKGGPGKTTASILATLGFARNGRRVAIQDTDLQGSFLMTLGLGLKNEKNIKLYEADDRDCDVVVIDSPPRIDERPFVRAIAEADLVVIPLKPYPVDLAALAKSLPALQQLAPKTKMVILFSGEETNTIMSKGFEANVREMGIDLPILQTSIHQYQCYPRVFVEGWNALSEAGRIEVPMLANELWDHVR